MRCRIRLAGVRWLYPDFQPTASVPGVWLSGPILRNFRFPAVTDTFSVKSPMRSDFAATLKGLPPAMTSPALDRMR